MFTTRTLDPALAGHPFRRTLPAHVLRALPVYEPEVEAAMEREALAIRSREVDWKHIGIQDVKDFLIAYCACFMAVMAFIA